MFFRKDYEAYEDPDAPEKTGWNRLGEIVSQECVTLVQLNLLFLLSCLPVVTIPPALSAMNYAVRRMVLGRPVHCRTHYWGAFRRSWRRGWGAFLATAGALYLSGWGAWFYLARAEENLLMFLPFMFCSTVFLLTLLGSVYLYPLLAAQRGLREALRLALLLGIGKPLRGIAAILAVYGASAAAVLAFPLSVPYWLLIGFSVPCLLGNFFVRTVLKQLGGNSDEGNDEDRI